MVDYFGVNVLRVKTGEILTATVSCRIEYFASLKQARLQLQRCCEVFIVNISSSWFEQRLLLASQD